MHISPAAAVPALRMEIRLSERNRMPPLSPRVALKHCVGREGEITALGVTPVGCAQGGGFARIPLLRAAGTVKVGRGVLTLWDNAMLGGESSTKGNSRGGDTESPSGDKGWGL